VSIDERDINLLGQKVRHITFGIGLIVSFTDNIIDVIFENMIKKQFEYPSCFETKYLYFLDSNLNNSLKKPQNSQVNIVHIKYDEFRTHITHYFLTERLLWAVYINYINDEEIYQKLKQDAIRIIKHSMEIEYGYPLQDRAVVTAFTSMVAFKYYDSGRFWEYLRYELKDLYDNLNNIQRMEATIRELISNQEKLNDSRQITNPLVHSAVPLQYMKKFLDFTYDIYERNFDHNIDGVSTNEILSITLDWLSKRFNSSDMDKDELSINVTQKTYTLIRSTKLAMIHYKKDMIFFLELMIGMINEWYYNDAITDKYPIIYQDVFLDWIEDNQAIASQRKLQNRQEYISQPTIRLNTDSKQVFLSMPSIPINNVEDVDLYNLQVILHDVNDLTLTLNKDYKIINRIGYFSIVFNKILIINPLSQISIRVLLNENTIYYSENSLYRDIIIFDAEGKEKSNNREYNGLVYVIHSKNDISKAKTIDKIHYLVSVFMAESTEVYHFGEKIIYFSKVMKPGLYGDATSDLIAKSGNEELVVYKSVSNFVFESQYPKSELMISINEHKIDFENNTHIIKKQGNYYNYSINLLGLSLNDDIKTIKIQRNGLQEIKSDTFVLDSGVHFEIRRLDDNSLSRRVAINSSFGQKKAQDILVDFKKQTIYQYDFNLGFTKISYIIDPYIPRYKWGTNEEWELLSEIEYKDSELIIASRIKKVEILSSEGVVIFSELPIRINDSTSEVDVSYLKQINNQHDFVDLRITYFNDLVHQTPMYLNTFVLGFNVLHLNQNEIQLNFDIKCFKKGELLFTLLKDDVVLEQSMLDEHHIKLSKLVEFNEYQIVITKKGNIFTNDEEKILYRNQYTLYDNGMLAGHMFKVNEVIYWDNDIEVNQRIRTTGILFDRKLDKRDKLAKESSIDTNNACYEIRFVKITYDNRRLPFRSKQKVYAEVVTRKQNPIITIYLEYDDAEGIGFSKDRGYIEENYNEYDTLIDHIIIDSRKDFIK